MLLKAFDDVHATTQSILKIHQQFACFVGVRDFLSDGFWFRSICDISYIFIWLKKHKFFFVADTDYEVSYLNNSDLSP